MGLSNSVALAIAAWLLLGGCSDQCINYAPPPGEQCGAIFCSRAAYCATDAGPPTCVSHQGPGAPCLRNAECAGGTCELDGGCGPIPPGGSSQTCG